MGNRLFDAKTKIDLKKKVLALLALLGTITAFRQIEKYRINPDNDLKQWTALALQECKMLLESTLTNQEIPDNSEISGIIKKIKEYYKDSQLGNV